MYTTNEVERQEKTSTSPSFWQKIDSIMYELNVFAVDKSLDFCQFGFNGSEEDVTSNAYNLSIKKIKSFNQESTNFSEQLQKKGIVPIAVLPKKLFSEICLKAETIYRFEGLDENGKTIADLRSLTSLIVNKKSKGRNIRNSIAWLFTAAMFTVWSIYAFNVGFDKKTADGPLTFAAVLIVSCLIGFKVACMNGNVKKKDLLEKMIQGKKGFDLTHALFPSRNDEIKSWMQEAEDEKITIRFSNPPKTFLESLCKIKSIGLNPCIAADKQAFDIDINSVRRAFDVREKFEQERLAQISRRDPILYVQNEAKTMVAICDYFGDFPSEEIVMDYVKKEGLKIVFN